MKYAIVFLFLLTGCGYSSIDVEMVGQVKKVGTINPLICPQRDEADISLGVIRNGVGSMSSEDVWVHVPQKSDFETLKKAADSAKLVKVIYDRKRLTFCTEERWVKRVEILE